MHAHFADHFSGIDFGAPTRIMFRIDADGGMPAPAPKPTTPAKPTATEQVKESTKNGKIAASERTVFEKGKNDSVVKSEEDRLHKAVAGKVLPFSTLVDDKGLPIRKDGKEQLAPLGLGMSQTDHTKKLKELNDGPKLQDTDAKIASTKRDLESFPKDSAGRATLQGQIDKLQGERDARAKAEGEIAKVVRDKTSLIGTLEGEKTSLETSRPAAAKNDYQDLREKAEPYLRMFREQGGQDYSPDWFGDDWDTNKDFNFDTMVKQFHGKSKQIDQWADHQDNDYQKAAVQELQGVMREYESARAANEKIDARIHDIKGEQEQLAESIKRDRDVLSQPTLKQLDADTSGDFDPAAADKADDPKTDAKTDTKPDSKTDSTTDKPADTTPKAGPDGPANTDGRPDSTNTDTDTPPAAGSDDTTTDTKPKATTRPVDYSTDAARAQVLTAAQKQGLVPEKNVHFDKDGQAIYTVQPGDSYWRVAQHSSGTSGGFDNTMFTNTMNTNSRRFQRQDPALLYIGDELSLSGRSVDDLVKLLNLPTVEPVPAEEEDHAASRAPRGADRMV